jgi:hypothetical protein
LLNQGADGGRFPDSGAPEFWDSRLPAHNRRRALNRVDLTPQEVAALLQGLSQAEADGRAQPGVPASRSPAGPGRRESRYRLRLRRISHWWAAVTELHWPQL